MNSVGFLALLIVDSSKRFLIMWFLPQWLSGEERADVLVQPPQAGCKEGEADGLAVWFSWRSRRALRVLTALFDFVYRVVVALLLSHPCNLTFEPTFALFNLCNLFH